MTDLATVRAEIKSWERSFKETNGRPPSVDDIKQNDAIANKYKLYKKLSKAATSGEKSIEKTAQAPLTPPRHAHARDTASKLLARTPMVQRTAALDAFNPFSPQKKTAVKAAKEPIASTSKSPFPKPPFRALEAKVLTNLPPAPATAVTRARKRLRGEPVSPSPIKEKRQRVIPQTSVSFARLRLGTPSSSEEDNDSPGDAFIDNSPVKPSHGRSFSLLFDDSKLTPTRLFADQLQPTRKKPKPSARLKPTRSTDLELDLTTKQRSPTGSPPPLSATSEIPSASASRASTKRPWSDDDLQPSGNASPKQRSRTPLIPPSPPPNDGSQRATGRSKARPGKKSRKKAKVGDDQEYDTEEEDLPPKLKIANRTARPLRTENFEDDLGHERDPLYSHFAAPHVPPDIADDPIPGEQNIDIQVPDELLPVLALPTAEEQDDDEDNLVKTLLYGRRVGHYDPQKGGEIWGVGENDEVADGESRNVAEEDDWEGEPVPWEVAEL